MPGPAQSPLLQHSCAGGGKETQTRSLGGKNGIEQQPAAGKSLLILGRDNAVSMNTSDTLGSVHCHSWAGIEGKSFQMSPCSSHQSPKAPEDRWAVAGAGGSSYHHEGVTDPQGVPAWRTRRDLNGLTVHSYHHGRSFTHNTSAHRASTRETGDVKMSQEYILLRILTLEKGKELTCERLAY